MPNAYEIAIEMLRSRLTAESKKQSIYPSECELCPCYRLSNFGSACPSCQFPRMMTDEHTTEICILLNKLVNTINSIINSSAFHFPENPDSDPV